MRSANFSLLQSIQFQFEQEQCIELKKIILEECRRYINIRSISKLFEYHGKQGKVRAQKLRDFCEQKEDTVFSDENEKKQLLCAVSALFRSSSKALAEAIAARLITGMGHVAFSSGQKTFQKDFSLKSVVFSEQEIKAAISSCGEDVGAGLSGVELHFFHSPKHMRAIVSQVLKNILGRADEAIISEFQKYFDDKDPVSIIRLNI